MVRFLISYFEVTFVTIIRVIFIFFYELQCDFKLLCELALVTLNRIVLPFCDKNPFHSSTLLKKPYVKKINLHKQKVKKKKKKTNREKKILSSRWPKELLYDPFVQWRHRLFISKT
jgi:hypothetical protein